MSSVDLMDQEDVRKELDCTLQRHPGNIIDKAERPDEILNQVDRVFTKERLARLLNVTSYTVISSPDVNRDLATLLLLSPKPKSENSPDTPGGPLLHIA